MNDNAESADSVSFDREALIPAESHSEPTGSNSESSSGNDDRDIRRQQHRPPLGVALTGYRLFTTCVILGPGIAKAVYSYKGQSLVSTTIEWAAGIVAIILFWLGVIEAERPELSPSFFKTDLAVLCLRFLSRNGVPYWFPSFGFVFYSAMPLLVTLGVRCDEEQSCGRGVTVHFIEAVFVLSALIFGASICALCLRALRLTFFKEYEPKFLRVIVFLMWVMCSVCFLALMIAVVVLRKDLKYRPLVPIFNAVAASLLYMCYDSMFFLKEDAGGYRGGHSPHIDLMVTGAVTFFTTQSVFTGLLGFLDLPGVLYVIFFMSCIVVLYSHSSFLGALKSGVSLIARVSRSISP